MMFNGMMRHYGDGNIVDRVAQAILTNIGKEHADLVHRCLAGEDVDHRLTVSLEKTFGSTALCLLTLKIVSDKRKANEWAEMVNFMALAYNYSTKVEGAVVDTKLQAMLNSELC